MFYFSWNFKKVVNLVESKSCKWSSENFEPIFHALCDYYNEFPKGDSIYSTKSKLDILRLHVTLCNKFTQRYPIIAKSVIERNQDSASNQIYSRIARELASIDENDEKVSF